MAEAKKIEGLKYETVQTGVTLTLTMKEAQMLQDVLGRVGGEPTNTRRKYANEVAEALRCAGVYYNYDMTDVTSGSGVYFTPTK